MSILIKNVLLNGKINDISVKENRIEKIASGITGEFDDVLDGSHHAAVPPFYNTHCHAAMTLLRGLADDLKLFDWLQNHIWPAEAKLDEESLYWGSRLACMEMIRSGTVFFNDMYFAPEITIRAVQETGIRACLGLISLDLNPEARARFQKIKEEMLEKRFCYGSRIQLSFAPHAIYSVEEQHLHEIAAESERLNMFVHTHLAETVQEVEDCRKAHGCSPVEYLERTGLLSDRLLAAHSIHLSDSDMELLKKRNVTLAYIPCSNGKLVSGSFQFRKAMEKGLHITVGTDGCASNNNLSMFDEIKHGAITAKMESGDPTVCSAEQIYQAATRSGAEAFGIDAGVIQEGKLADLLLIDLDQPMMVANHNLISNLVYSADSSCVSTVICDGKIVMKDRVIPGMWETIENARKCAERLKQ